MTNEYANTHVLLTGVCLPPCCRPQSESSAATRSTSASPPRLLLVEVARINSLSGLSYVAWKCTSGSTPTSSSSGIFKQEKRHSQWIPLRHVAVVSRQTPNVNFALERGPYDSKFDVDNHQVELWRSKSDSMGRFTVAKQRIRIGERAFQATAFAVVVRQSLALRRCHWCFTVLRKKALQCGDCQFSRYCSRECLTADATLHDFQCPALKELKCRSDGEDVETVRLVLAVLSMEKFVGTRNALEMLVNNRRQDPGDDDKMRSSVKMIVEMTGRVLDVKHVYRTLERVRCNAHPLYLDGVTCVGTGLFPEAAMALNHSCLPNVAPSFDPRTRMLAFHAIADIPQGHAVECAYIDLLQSRKRRQSLLSDGFGFDCMCQRCSEEASRIKTGHCSATQREENEEEEVMEQLMRIMNTSGSDAPQCLAQLRKEHEQTFQRSVEAQFAFHTAEMQLARTRGNWTRVVTAAETLLDIWARSGLPESCHTTETLYLQIHSAAKEARMVEKAQASAQRVIEIRRICGYPCPEASVV